MTELAEGTTLTRYNKKGVDELFSCVRRRGRGGRAIKVLESNLPEQNKRWTEREEQVGIGDS